MPGQESFISFNIWTALFTLLNTLTVYFVLKHFLFQPIMKLIKERQDEIDTMYADADKARQEAARLEQNYQQKLDTAAQTTDRLMKEAVERGQMRENEIIRNANAQASAIRDKAAADIAQEKKKALNDAKDEISDMALAIAEKVIGRELKSADQDALFEQFLQELGEQS